MPSAAVVVGEGGVSARDRMSAWGVSAPRGVCLEGCIPPLVDRMTEACENITFPQLLLRTVEKKVMMSSQCKVKEPVQ